MRIVMVSARELVGKRIAVFDPGTRRDEGGGVYHSPTLTLEDGSVLRFSAEETATAFDYGVLIRRSRQKGTKP